MCGAGALSRFAKMIIMRDRSIFGDRTWRRKRNEPFDFQTAPDLELGTRDFSFGANGSEEVSKVYAKQKTIERLLSA